MNDARLVVRQVAYEQKAFWRNPVSAGFTFLFPIMFLVIFGTLNKGATIGSLGEISYNQYYVPSILAFGLMGACYTNLAIQIALRRDTGALKRLRGTPLPAWGLIGGLLGNAVVVSVVLVALTTAVGVLAYDVRLFPGRALALLVALLAGAACFCALGVMVASFVPNGDAAPAVVNLVFFPLVFISGTFFPVPADSILHKIATVFPLQHFIAAVFATFDPRGHGGGWAWQHLVVVLAWGVGATVLGARRFRWETPRH